MREMILRTAAVLLLQLAAAAAAPTLEPHLPQTIDCPNSDIHVYINQTAVDRSEYTFVDWNAGNLQDCVEKCFGNHFCYSIRFDVSLEKNCALYYFAAYNCSHQALTKASTIEYTTGSITLDCIRCPGRGDFVTAPPFSSIGEQTIISETAVLSRGKIIKGTASEITHNSDNVGKEHGDADAENKDAHTEEVAKPEGEEGGKKEGGEVEGSGQGAAAAAADDAAAAAGSPDAAAAGAEAGIAASDEATTAAAAAAAGEGEEEAAASSTPGDAAAAATEESLTESSGAEDESTTAAAAADEEEAVTESSGEGSEATTETAVEGSGVEGSGDGNPEISAQEEGEPEKVDVETTTAWSGHTDLPRACDGSIRFLPSSFVDLDTVQLLINSTKANSPAECAKICYEHHCGFAYYEPSTFICQFISNSEDLVDTATCPTDLKSSKYQAEFRTDIASTMSCVVCANDSEVEPPAMAPVASPRRGSYPACIISFQADEADHSSFPFYKSIQVKKLNECARHCFIGECSQAVYNPKTNECRLGSNPKDTCNNLPIIQRVDPAPQEEVLLQCFRCIPEDMINGASATTEGYQVPAESLDDSASSNEKEEPVTPAAPAAEEEATTAAAEEPTTEAAAEETTIAAATEAEPTTVSTEEETSSIVAIDESQTRTTLLDETSTTVASEPVETTTSIPSEQETRTSTVTEQPEVYTTEAVENSTAIESSESSTTAAEETTTLTELENSTVAEPENSQNSTEAVENTSTTSSEAEKTTVAEPENSQNTTVAAEETSTASDTFESSTVAEPDGSPNAAENIGAEETSTATSEPENTTVAELEESSQNSTVAESELSENSTVVADETSTILPDFENSTAAEPEGSLNATETIGSEETSTTSQSESSTVAEPEGSLNTTIARVAEESTTNTTAEAEVTTPSLDESTLAVSAVGDEPAAREQKEDQKEAVTTPAEPDNTTALEEEVETTTVTGEAVELEAALPEGVTEAPLEESTPLAMTTEAPETTTTPVGAGAEVELEEASGSGEEEATTPAAATGEIEGSGDVEGSAIGAAAGEQNEDAEAATAAAAAAGGDTGYDGDAAATAAPEEATTAAAAVDETAEGSTAAGEEGASTTGGEESTTLSPEDAATSEGPGEMSKVMEANDQPLILASEDLDFGKSCVIKFQAAAFSARPSTLTAPFEKSFGVDSIELCATRCFQDGCTGAKYEPETHTCHLSYEDKSVCDRTELHLRMENVEGDMWIHCVNCYPEKSVVKDVLGAPLTKNATGDEKPEGTEGKSMLDKVIGAVSGLAGSITEEVTGEKKDNILGHGCIVNFQTTPSSEIVSTIEYLPPFKTRYAHRCATKCFQEGCAAATFNPATNECSLGYGQFVKCGNKQLQTTALDVKETVTIHCMSCIHHKPGEGGIDLVVLSPDDSRIHLSESQDLPSEDAEAPDQTTAAAADESTTAAAGEGETAAGAADSEHATGAAESVEVNGGSLGKETQLSESGAGKISEIPIEKETLDVPGGIGVEKEKEKSEGKEGTEAAGAAGKFKPDLPSSFSIDSGAKQMVGDKDENPAVGAAAADSSTPAAGEESSTAAAAADSTTPAAGEESSTAAAAADGSSTAAPEESSTDHGTIHPSKQIEEHPLHPTGAEVDVGSAESTTSSADSSTPEGASTPSGSEATTEEDESGSAFVQETPTDEESKEEGLPAAGDDGDVKNREGLIEKTLATATPSDKTAAAAAEEGSSTPAAEAEEGSTAAAAAADASDLHHREGLLEKALATANPAQTTKGDESSTATPSESSSTAESSTGSVEGASTAPGAASGSSTESSSGSTPANVGEAAASIDEKLSDELKAIDDENARKSSSTGANGSGVTSDSSTSSPDGGSSTVETLTSTVPSPADLAKAVHNEQGGAEFGQTGQRGSEEEEASTAAGGEGLSRAGEGESSTPSTDGEGSSTASAGEESSSAAAAADDSSTAASAADHEGLIEKALATATPAGSDTEASTTAAVLSPADLAKQQHAEKGGAEFGQTGQRGSSEEAIEGAEQSDAEDEIKASTISAVEATTANGESLDGGVDKALAAAAAAGNEPVFKTTTEPPVQAVKDILEALASGDFDRALQGKKNGTDTTKSGVPADETKINQKHECSSALRFSTFELVDLTTKFEADAVALSLPHCARLCYEVGCSMAAYARFPRPLCLMHFDDDDEKGRCNDETNRTSYWQYSSLQQVVAIECIVCDGGPTFFEHDHNVDITTLHAIDDAVVTVPSPQGISKECDGGRLEFQFVPAGSLPRLNVTNDVPARTPADCARKCHETKGCTTAGYIPTPSAEIANGVCLLTSDDEVCISRDDAVPQHASVTAFVISCIRCTKCSYTLSHMTLSSSTAKFQHISTVKTIGECAATCNDKKCTFAQYDATTNTCALSQEASLETGCHKVEPAIAVKGAYPVRLECVQCRE